MRTLVVCLSAFLVYRIATTCIAWTNEEKELAAVAEVIRGVEPGSKVLYVSATRDQLRSYGDHAKLGEMVGGAPAFIHFPALLILNQSAFCQLLLAVPGTTPFKVNPAYLAMSQPEGLGIPYPMLDARLRTPGELASFPFLAHWERDFDYVLALPVGLIPGGKALFPGTLQPVATNDFAALYRIKKPDS